MVGVVSTKSGSSSLERAASLSELRLLLSGRFSGVRGLAVVG